jgi:hypothetical protein
MGGNIRNYEEPFLEHLNCGEFSIDNEGRIWRHFSGPLGRIFKRYPNPIRAERQSKPGSYLQVRFWHEGRRVSPVAHRLVYRFFKGPIPEGAEVNHDNGIKDHNPPTNLLLSTSSENIKHANRYGLRDQHGQKNPAAKLTDNQVAQIRLAYSKGGFTMEQLGERFGVRFQHISRLVRGQRRRKQGGPTADSDLRHNACDRDPVSGRYVAPSVPEAPMAIPEATR